MEQYSGQGGAKSTTRTFSFRLGGAYFWKKEVRSLISQGFGQGYYARLSFTGQQYFFLFVRLCCFCSAIVSVCIRLLLTVLAGSPEGCSLSAYWGFLAVWQQCGSKNPLISYGIFRLRGNIRICASMDSSPFVSGMLQRCNGRMD